MAQSRIPQPVHITVPGPATIVITGTTNALYHQKVTVLDVTGGKEYIFRGSGEGVSMQVEGHQNQDPVTFATAGDHTLSVFCQYSVSGVEGSFRESQVILRSPGEGSATGQPIVWEFDTEDGVDSDFNDSVIRIVASLEQ